MSMCICRSVKILREPQFVLLFVCLYVCSYFLCVLPGVCLDLQMVVCLCFRAILNACLRIRQMCVCFGSAGISAGTPCFLLMGCLFRARMKKIGVAHHGDFCAI